MEHLTLDSDALAVGIDDGNDDDDDDDDDDDGLFFEVLFLDVTFALAENSH